MSFKSDIKRFNTFSDDKLEKFVRTVALAMDASLVKKTPIDTGRAKANWNVSPGKIDTTVTKKTTRIQPTLKKGDGKKPIYITNSLHYIIYLEHGHSIQARNPDGMVQVTMSEFSALQGLLSNVLLNK